MLKLKVNDTPLHDTSSESYGASLAMGLHRVTFDPTQVNSPRLTPARQAGIRFTYRWGMEGSGDLLHTEMVYPPADGQKSKY